MKKLTFILAAAAVLMLSTPASAQWGAGFGFSQFTHSGSDKVLDEAIPGFYFGIKYDFNFSTLEGLSFEPGVNIVHYGKTYSYLGFGEKEYRANYLSIPLNIKYTVEAGDDFTLSGFTGPRFNLGLGGNMFSRGETYPGLKAHDAQWGFGVAGTYSDAIQLRLGYDFGLTKSIKGVKGADVSPKVFRNVLTFGIAFLF